MVCPPLHALPKHKGLGFLHSHPYSDRTQQNKPKLQGHTCKARQSSRAWASGSLHSSLPWQQCLKKKKKFHRNGDSPNHSPREKGKDEPSSSVQHTKGQRWSLLARSGRLSLTHRLLPTYSSPRKEGQHSYSPFPLACTNSCSTICKKSPNPQLLHYLETSSHRIMPAFLATPFSESSWAVTEKKLWAFWGRYSRLNPVLF